MQLIKQYPNFIAIVCPYHHPENHAGVSRYGAGVADRRVVAR